MLTHLTKAVTATALLTAIAGSGCDAQTQSEAQAQTTTQPSDQDTQTIEFAGMTWRVKHQMQGDAGPGPNYFSADKQDVWVDDEGRLHMTLTQRDGKWHCTEVVSELATGYGEYEFQVVGAVDQLDPNIVLGLFTWNSDSWKTDANSEIDIELTRWAEADALNLHYSVHPGWGPDTPDGKHPERTEMLDMELQGDTSTHVINWAPTVVTCASYQGSGQDPENLIANWTFDDSNPPRIASNGQGETTEPILIPKPGKATNARINLWLVNADRKGLGDPPTDGQDVEVIISAFRYTPAAAAQTQPDDQ